MASKGRDGWTRTDGPENSYEDDNAVWIDRPAEGEELQGILLERTPDAGQYDTTLLKLRRTDEFESVDDVDDPDDATGPVVLMWSSDIIDGKLDAHDLNSGDELLIEGVDTRHWENGDEEGTMVDHEVYFK